MDNVICTWRYNNTNELSAYIVKMLHFYLAILRCRRDPSTSEGALKALLDEAFRGIIIVGRSYLQVDLTPAGSSKSHVHECTLISSHRDPLSTDVE